MTAEYLACWLKNGKGIPFRSANAWGGLFNCRVSARKTGIHFCWMRGGLFGGDLRRDHRRRIDKILR